MHFFYQNLFKTLREVLNCLARPTEKMHHRLVRCIGRVWDDQCSSSISPLSYRFTKSIARGTRGIQACTSSIMGDPVLCIKVKPLIGDRTQQKHRQK